MVWTPPLDTELIGGYIDFLSPHQFAEVDKRNKFRFMAMEDPGHIIDYSWSVLKNNREELSCDAVIDRLHSNKY